MSQAHKALPIALGTLAQAMGLAIVGLNAVFAASLFSQSSKTHAHIIAIIAIALEVMAVIMLALLLLRRLRDQRVSYLRNVGRGKRYNYLLAGLAAGFAILGAGASAVAFAMVQKNIDVLPAKTYSLSTRTLVIVAFIIWAVCLVFQAVFLIAMVVFKRQDIRQHFQDYHSDSLPQIQTRQIDSLRPRSQSAPESAGPRMGSMEPESSPESSRRSRSGSVRSYTSQCVRPMTSKTRLIPGRQQIIHYHNRAPSLDSAHQESPAPEDGFDSWDTSAVDPPTRHAVESASPTTPRFLETIPQSPTGSRAPSPGFPLDLNPPRSRQRSRSFSPATSTLKERPRTPRTQSPAGSTHESQAHIHPLFRSDSPTPPPCTPGTMVTAAPGAGLLVADRNSIKSMKRMRSGSLPSSPLMHSTSMDNIKHEVDREGSDTGEDHGIDIERRLTPPIPDWIMARQSILEYQARKTTMTPPIGLGIGRVGEAL